MTMSRRRFFGQTAAVSAGAVLAQGVGSTTAGAVPDGERAAAGAAGAPGEVTISFRLNGDQTKVTIDPRVTLLDLLRERLELTGTKKGCDRGQCGACTVHVDGRRVVSCLTLAAMVNGRSVTTIEGLSGDGDRLHPVQRAFVECDALQCGFCTPGQVMSAVAFLREGGSRSEAAVREGMSGNICRCGAYPNIVDAVRKAAG
jgi:xanthine dehydrogenase YagT iron-sulfur-binding subunit